MDMIKAGDKCIVTASGKYYGKEVEVEEILKDDVWDYSCWVFDDQQYLNFKKGELEKKI